MDVAISYNRLVLECLPAVAAGCSRNVALTLIDRTKGRLSMAPACDSIRSRNSIILFILNINPFDEIYSANILWFEKCVKPVLYRFYKSFNPKIQDKNLTSSIQLILEEVDEKFGQTLLAKINPIELLIWGDFYLIFMDNSPYKFNLPSRLSKWFSEINKIESLQRAVGLVLGNVMDNLQEIVRNISVPPIVHLESETDSCLIDSERDIITETFLNGYRIVTDPLVSSSPKLPMANNRNILITSALPYVNNVPHLGNLIGSTLSADVFSRYCRSRGWNVLYVCGTDEYGTTTEVKATEEKLTPREICDKYSSIHQQVYQWFNINFDIFGRTSTDKHTEIVCEIFKSIHKQGFIIEDTVSQLYCEKCDKFLADRLVEGTCPFGTCNYEDARGDQCDRCGKLINPVELKNPRCKMCGSSPVVRSSQHLFLDLSKIQQKLEYYLREKMESVHSVWSINAKSITNSWLKEGLRPRCITRDLKWGVPVPLAGFEKKVFYVWFDAVLGYISITACYTDDWKKWWLADESTGRVELFQFMAKDNVPFHSVILPANLLATGEKWNMIQQLAATEYLNYEGGKFSKSRGLGVFGNDAITSGIDADIWRFYLISTRPESQDSSFSWTEFATRNNSELLNNLGNFINRALSFVTKFFSGHIPDFRTCCFLQKSFDSDEMFEFISEVNNFIKSYVTQMDQIKLRDALFTVLKISGLGNCFIQKHKPWVTVKSLDTKKQADIVIGIAANVVVILGVLLAPIMPTIADKILQQCNAPDSCRQISADCRLRAFLQPNHEIGVVVPLFEKMEPEFVEKLRQKFSSSD